MIALLLLVLWTGDPDTTRAGLQAGVYIGPRLSSVVYDYMAWFDFGLQAGYADIFLRASMSVNLFESGGDWIDMVDGQTKPELGSDLWTLTMGKQWRNPHGRWFALGAGWGGASTDSLAKTAESRRFVELDSSGRVVEPAPCKFPFGCDAYGWAWSEAGQKTGPVVFGEVGWEHSGGAVSLKAEYLFGVHLSLLLWARIP